MKLWADNPETSFSAYSVNISETGMLVLSEGAWPRGSELSFEISPELNGKCEVIWTREPESGGTFLGMKFHSLRRGARKTLAELMATSREG